ncbi:hypothetical protein AAG570_008902, partial [Ranatra chinensis]
DCICLGAIGTGKTLLLKRLQASKAIDFTSSSVPTVGTTLKSIKLNSGRVVTIREVGGTMAPLWNQYYTNVPKIMFVVDASNLCQISASGVLLYTLLSEPTLQKSKVLLVLSKMDASYRQMRNEALLMLQINRLQKEIPQHITIAEVSSFTSEGIDSILKWLDDK